MCNVTSCSDCKVRQLSENSWTNQEKQTRRRLDWGRGKLQEFLLGASCWKCPCHTHTAPPPPQPLTPPTEGPSVTHHSPALIPSSHLPYLYLSQQMHLRPPGPTLPALVVLGHLVTLILFWRLRKPKKKGRRAACCRILKQGGFCKG